MPLAIELGAATSRPYLFTISPSGSAIVSLCSPVVTAPLSPATRPCGPLSSGATNCSTNPNGNCSRLCRSSPGGSIPAGAEAVGGGHDLDTLNVLDSLIDQSLVTAEIRNRSEARYRMLETLRQYGDEVLADRETVAARHSGFYLELAEEGARRLRVESGWYERLDRELDNLRKAIGWTLGPGGQAETAARCAVALREFWQVRGHWREAQHWLDLCLEQADQLPTRLVGQLHHAAGVTSALRRDYDRAFPHLEAALELFRQSGRPADVADALFDLSQAAARHGDYARAETLLSESRALYEKDGNQTGLAEACCVLAQVAVFRGDREEAGIQGGEASKAISRTRRPVRRGVDTVGDG